MPQGRHQASRRSVLAGHGRAILRVGFGLASMVGIAVLLVASPPASRAAQPPLLVSWNPAVSCVPVRTTVEAILGSQTNSNGGATQAGGWYGGTGVPDPTSLTPPCQVNGAPVFVELHDMHVTPFNCDGSLSDGTGTGDCTGNIWDNSAAGQTLLNTIAVDIDGHWIAGGIAPGTPPTDSLIDIQGFVYWSPGHGGDSSHSYSGWELHPVSAWRPTTTNEFSISATPSQVSVDPNGSTSLTVSTSVTGGSSQAVTLSATGLPSGVTASFSPPTVASGASSTLTLSASGSAAAGYSNLSVVGSGPSATHSTPLLLSVAPWASCGSAYPTPVACENSKQGSPPSVWSINGSGSANIQGFATEISVNHGQSIDFKVDTDATAYHLDIYRVGYYQGNGARFITSIEPSAALPQVQPDCLFDPTTNLVDCGNWSVSATWNVPAAAVSGVYFAELVRDDGTPGTSQIMFIVRADESHSDLYFQTSDATWEAYNRYGGHSLYYPSSARAYKVSYNRPFITRDCCDETFFWSAEYPMVRWLERNGYDVSYESSVDTDRYGSLLLNHKVFMSVGHDEYWSGGQRANVEAARSAGVNLAFFSGNEIFWKTRYESSIYGSDPSYRTLVTYKETYAGAKIDPSPQWTGTWRDPRFSPPSDGGHPENALSGQMFMVNCCSSTDVPNLAIQVPYGDSKMRFWRNTSIANLQPGQVATLPTYTLGYEWDEVVDNGQTPPGLIEMSTTTADVSQLLQDYGNTYAPGTATHHLTLYRTPSGALVFAAGTIRWSWGLDGVHDEPASTPSQDMQQATVNLFADMGVQPSTLQAALVPATKSTDVAPPTSTIVSPSAGSSISQDVPVVVSGTATDAGGGVVGGVEVSVDGGVTWHPATGRGNWTYTWTPSAPGNITIKSRAVDDSGNLETPSAGDTITVILRNCPCTVFPDTATPAGYNTSTTGTEVGMKFTADYDGFVTGLRFYKGATDTGIHVGHLWNSTGTLLGTVTFSGETATGWQVAQFPSPVAITAGTTYVISYYAPNGGFGQTVNYFATGVDRAPLHAPANTTASPNGVYRYGSSGFPKSTYGASNYWVDPIYVVKAPAAPTGLVATTASSSKINLSWNDVAQETSFKIQRSLDGSTNWTQIAITPAGVITYSDTGLSPGTTYYYRVLASNPGGDSTPSSVASATTTP
jgi:hypothetical protein